MSLPAGQIETAALLARLTGAVPVETHISAVYVGPDAAYKLKKAVRLSFVDFSTLPARRAMALRECALNRIAAPGLYRGVKAICQDSCGALHLAPADSPGAVDYVVEMAPVAAGDFLDVIAHARGLTPALLDALGDCIAALHAKLPPVLGVDAAASLRGIAQGNAVAAHDAGLDAAIVARWLARILTTIETLAPALAARAAAGLVRRAHGDLHLGNLCLWQGRPVAFDMLEFDEALATIDTGYDLAFLLMDLEHQAGRPAANRVMNRYLARSGDIGLTAGMPAFLSMRALIRAHVQASRGQARDAAAYLAMALDLLAARPARLVAIGGLQATGKTTLARALAPDLGRAPGAIHLRSDEIRKRLHGVAPEAKLPAAAYGPGANARVNAAVLDAAAAGVQAGQAVIADSTFLHAPLRRGIEAVARAAGVRFTGIWLEAELDTAIARAAARQGDASDAGPEIVRAAARVDPGRISWARITADDGTLALAAARAQLDELPVQPRSAVAQDAGHCAGHATGSADDERHDDR